MTPERSTDPAGLGRGRLTRRFPVLWQAPPSPPPVEQFAVAPGTGPRRFTARVAVAAPRLTVPAAALAIVQNAATASIPVIMGLAIDRALQTGDLVQLSGWLALLGITFLCLALAFRVSAFLAARAVQTVEHRLRSTLSGSVLHPADGRVRRPDGVVLSTATNDLTRLSTAVNLGVFPVGELAGITVVAVSLLVIHWPLGVAVLLGAPVVVWLMGALSGPFSRTARHAQSLLAVAVGRATDLVTGYRVVKGVRAEEEATRRYRHESRAALTGAYTNLGALGRYLAGSNTISGLFVAGIAGLAGFFAVAGEITIGELIAVAGLTQALLPPLNLLTANAGAVWAAAVGSGERVLDLLRAAGDAPEPAAPPPGPATPPVVEVIADGDEPIRLEPGAVIGLHADDRTANAIVGSFLAPRGVGRMAEVLLDGVPAAELDPADYRAAVVVAPHEAGLFSGTVAENLDLPGAAPHHRATALWAAACDDFVSGTPGGLDIQVGENGNRLSGGQRQRLALARAYARDAQVLVLHEPTTAVDSVTGAAIADRLRRVRAGRSTLLVTTSPVLLARCDRVVEPGAHAGGPVRVTR
ncbi:MULTISPECIES: ABC transporter ATP-binding protein [Pseudonocardia]|uniref:Multidrug ABC transporter ATP-binding protein n=2 Tax=Pseudonocardia TaxID=1847 RepID=A0ABQ0RV83_9PSEU|nr:MULTISPECIES: ABC transporter ATP-binding protein [Pseudonocardia]OSY38350.1 putative ABC transporter ATP-binding protein [Pseudonocardia autotrophica]TDN72605.1 ABC-type multidrug transport system fused ATPase/permease subunit [Pseudonocardia autotrophica]BBG03314.1 multidrug ABC transporter ATP-binding protein [Pseudonocardia autotrophica]GEC24572.1 multidrug ABC transporter ATP-binding protein [Pseudonocardia saturnea]